MSDVPARRSQFEMKLRADKPRPHRNEHGATPLLSYRISPVAEQSPGIARTSSAGSSASVAVGLASSAARPTREATRAGRELGYLRLDLLELLLGVALRSDQRVRVNDDGLRLCRPPAGIDGVAFAAL